MKKFLLKLALFLLPIFLMWGGLEVFYRTVPNNYTEKANNISLYYNTAEVLILGNSHSFYGLNPDDFYQKAYNLANISQSLYFDELLLYRHIDRFSKLKYVVVNVDYFTLSQEDDKMEDKWRKYFYHAQMDVDVPAITGFDVKQYSLALAPRYSITAENIRKYRESGTLAEGKTNGWAPKQGVDTTYNNARFGKIIANKHEYGTDDFSNNINRLQRMITACSKRGVKVLLVTMPVISHYADNVDKVKLHNIKEVCRQLEAKNNNAAYLDLFQHPLFNNNDFHDTDHLNIAGAKKCSVLVSKTLEQI